MSISAKTAWECLGKTNLGRWIFGRIISFKAPYFATIRPKFQRLETGYCQVALRKRRTVLNHVGTVHAIAMCNAAELAAGLAIEVMLPTSYRWIPKGMNVNYLKPARTDLVVMAQCTLPEDLGESAALDVTAEAKDNYGITVFRAVITMYVSKRC